MGFPAGNWLVLGLCASLAACSGPVTFEDTAHVEQAAGACTEVSLVLGPRSPLPAGEPITLTAKALDCEDPRYFFSVRFRNGDGTWSPWAGLQRGRDPSFGPVAYTSGKYQFRVRAKEGGAPDFHLLAKRQVEWCESLTEEGTCAPATETSCTWWHRESLRVTGASVLASGSGGTFTLVDWPRITRHRDSTWSQIAAPDVAGTPTQAWQTPDGPLLLALAHDPFPCDQPEDCTGASVCSEGVCAPQHCQDTAGSPPYGDSCSDCPPGHVPRYTGVLGVYCEPGFSVWRYDTGWQELHRSARETLQLLGSTSTNVFWLEAPNGSLGGRLNWFDGSGVSERLRTDATWGPRVFLKAHDPVFKQSLWWFEDPADGDPVQLPGISQDSDPMTQLGPASLPQLLYHDEISVADPPARLGTIDGWTDVSDPGPLADVLGGVWPNIIQRSGNDVSRWDGTLWTTYSLATPADLAAERMVLLDDTSSIGVITAKHVGVCEPFGDGAE